MDLKRDFIGKVGQLELENAVLSWEAATRVNDYLSYASLLNWGQFADLLNDEGGLLFTQFRGGFGDYRWFLSLTLACQSTLSQVLASNFRLNTFALLGWPLR